MGMADIRYLLFDLDNTLYTDSTGLFLEVGERIETWTAGALSIERNEAKALRHVYYTKYGTTMAGLLREHPEVDIDAFLDYVHDIDVSRYLAPNLELAAMLDALPAPKVVFTNSISSWAERVTQTLGIRDRFEDIYDVRAVGYRCKPDAYAFEWVLNRLDLPGEACVMLDDQVSYLTGAVKAGMRTVLVREGAQVSDGIEYAVDGILEAGPLLQGLLAKG